MSNCQTVQSWPGRSAEALAGAIWRTSSYSGTQGNCVEVATNLPGIVAIRDSKDPGGLRLIVTPAQWASILSGLNDSQHG